MSQAGFREQRTRTLRTRVKAYYLLAPGWQSDLATITYALRLLEVGSGPAFVFGMHLVAVDGMCLNLPDNAEHLVPFSRSVSKPSGSRRWPAIRWESPSR